MTDPKTQFVDLENARVEEQKNVMAEIMAEGHCPFCPENFEKYHQKPILKEGKFWIITENQWPYEHVKLQLLAIYKTHAETLPELDPQAGAELIQLFSEVIQEKQIPGGGLAMRFGDTNYSAGTVKHIHAQFIWPDIEQPNFESVRIKIGKAKK